jgi:hypothetical protein
LPRLRQLVQNLWQQDGVCAIWLGGSLAAGNADRYSDVDLRIAVRPDAFENWKRQRDLSALFGAPCLAHHVQPFGERLILHHMLLADGDIYDLLVMPTDHEHREHAILILGCRDESFAPRLARFGESPTTDDPPADPAIVRQLLCTFWLNSHKHRKVLARGLNALALFALATSDHATLIRLWYTLHTGRNAGLKHISIHGLTQQTRTIEQRVGPGALAMLGAGLTTRGQIILHIEAVRDEVARVGRRLAQTLNFEYPTELEETVRRGWREFLQTNATT